MNKTYNSIRILTDSQIEQIHVKSLEILEKIGIKVDSEVIRDVFSDNGCRVEGKRVYIPGLLSEKMSKMKQKNIKIYSRTGQFIESDKNKIHVHNSGAVAKIFDYKSGLLKEAKLEDAKNLVILMDALDNIDAITPIVYPQDVEQELSLLYATRETLKNTTKPFHGPGISSTFEAKYIYEMLLATAGNEKQLREYPMVSFGFSTISPLTFPKEDMEALLWSVQKGIPISALPAPIAGMTAPITMLGALTQQNAEVLAVLTLVRLIDPDVPLSYSARLVHSDLRYGKTDGGSPETGILGACAVQLANYYGLESDVYGAGTSSILPDSQMGYEKMINILIPAIAGGSWLSGMGSLDDASTVSYEQLVIDNEIFGYALHDFGSLKDGEEDYGFSAIKDVMNGKSQFLYHEDTLKYLRSQEIWNRNGKISNNNGYEDDYEEIVEKARSKVEEILHNYEIEPINIDIEKEFDRIIELARKEIGA